jgi:hypothetical protein
MADHIGSIALHAMKDGFPIHSPAVGSRISSTTGAVPGCRDDRHARAVPGLAMHGLPQAGIAAAAGSVRISLPRGGIAVRLAAQNLIFLLYFFKKAIKVA